ncbi:MAG: sigma-70 family RNA polymerase sigma factor [Solirubrobacteraceae bacterium]
MSEPRSCRRVPGTPCWLIDAAQRGDRPAQHQLLKLYESLVRSVAYRLKPPPHLTREDLAQEARIGLLAAISAWRPERGPFPPFAHRCALNQAMLAVQAGFARKHELLNRAASLERTVCFSGEGRLGRRPLTLIDALATPADARADPESRLLVREELTCVLRAMPALSDSERTALARAIDGERYGRLGPALGRTPKAASQVVYRARRKLAHAVLRAP